MGGHYGSVQLRTEDRSRVLAAAEAVAREMNIKCLVGPALNGWVGVYPEGNGQDEKVGQRIAAAVGGHGLHLMVHDDDVLAYWLWHDGQLVDRYWSAPGYFGEENRAEEEPLVGDPERFAFALNESRRSELAAVLDREDGPTFEQERLTALGKALGVRNLVTAYEYLKGGETEDIAGWPRRFKEVPVETVTTERKQRSTEAKRIKAERDRLRAAGTLLAHDERTDPVVAVCAAGDGFAVVRVTLETGKNHVEHHRPPWGSASVLVPMQVPSGTFVGSIAANGSGRRVGTPTGDRVQVWDVADGGWRHVIDVPAAPHAAVIVMSADGARIAHAFRDKVTVSDADTGATVATVAGPNALRRMAFSPDGAWLVTVGNTLRLTSLAIPAVPRNCAVRVPRRADGSRPTDAEVAAIESELSRQRVGVEEARRELGLKLSLGGRQLSRAEQNELAESYQRLLDKTAGRMRELEQQIGLQEACFCVGFDDSGHYLWVGTEAGLRVYDWAAVLAGTGDSLPPVLHAVELPDNPRLPDFRRAMRPVHAAAADHRGNGIIFGGMSDDLFRLDPTTGVTTRIVTLPGGGCVTGIVAHADGSSLGVASHWWSMETLRRQDKQRWAWEVWDYRRLLAGA